MPQINSIPEVTYDANQPYHYLYDNLPLQNILTRIGLVNIQVDANTDILRGSCGTAGSLSNRLDASLKDSGDIKAEAVDKSLHNIGHHVDGTGPDGVEYVRMKTDERSKLADIGSGANNLQIDIEDTLPTIGSFVTFTNGTLRIRNSPTIFFDFEAPDILKAHSIFPPDAAHRHHYDVIPAYDIPSSPTYKIFKTTSINTPFEEGSLRVYVNGFRLTNAGVDVPDYSDPNAPWIPTYVKSQDHTTGAFELNRELTNYDVIRIDFDEVFLVHMGPTPTPSGTGPTPTPSPSPTPSGTGPTSTPSRTPEPSRTPTRTPWPTRTPTNTPSPSRTPTSSPTRTPTPTNTPSPSRTPTSSPTPTNTPSPSQTPTST
jgi:hypothetical protein